MILKKLVLICIACLGAIYTVSVPITHSQMNSLYSYRKPQPICSTMTTLLQPIMSVFLKNKITHACHWKETTWNPDDRALVVNRGLKPNRVLRDANFLDFLNHIAQELGHPETIIIEPKNHREDWQLIFYSPHDDMAQESTITVRGAVEILSDGESHVIGKDASGELIELIKTPKKPARTIPYI